MASGWCSRPRRTSRSSPSRGRGLRRSPVLGHKPTVLVLDLSMPGTPSLEILPKIAATSPDTAVVVLTMQNEGPPSPARRSASARLRDQALGGLELVDAVRSAVAGETYINPQLGARMVAEADLGPPDDLTPVRSRSSALWRSAT